MTTGGDDSSAVAMLVGGAMLIFIRASLRVLQTARFNITMCVESQSSLFERDFDLFSLVTCAAVAVMICGDVSGGGS